ncbi:hypothetical protein DFQ00_10587 [Paenibacillus barcinonensis]|uniref:Uncharacterized protein n=1 Tax=Paenibacillus barcinonensis TaxID=198119 RepID=A0A2V4VK08_PAEBA|nr:hypothetical protein DFQ00_10587 [Paenibacillus barcinonensis]
MLLLDHTIMLFYVLYMIWIIAMKFLVYQGFYRI